MNKKVISIIILIVFLVFFVLMALKGAFVKEANSKVEMTIDRVNAIYNYGIDTYENKQYDKALKAFEIVINDGDSDDQIALAIYKSAEIHEQNENSKKAKKYYQKLVTAFPGYPELEKVQNKIEQMNIKELFSPFLNENSIAYVIKSGDTLGAIAAKYNTTVALLKQSNNLKSDVIIPGKTLKIHKGKFSILVDKSQNLLFLKRNGEIFKTYQVATGKNNSTPLGKFTIEEKMVKPLWYRVGAVVEADSKDYELGTRWLGLSVDGYGIHGTKEPSSIGKQATLGCVRMMNKDVEEVFVIVPSGSEVVVVD